MPYIITTGYHALTQWIETDRRAVATLDEASEIVIAAFESQFSGIVNVSGIDESGGTIGPLPDGTVIEVEHASWDDLVGPGGWNAHSTEAEVIAAFNEGSQ
jgi:hypothetical protein